MWKKAFIINEIPVSATIDRTYTCWLDCGDLSQALDTNIAETRKIGGFQWLRDFNENQSDRPKIVLWELLIFLSKSSEISNDLLQSVCNVLENEVFPWVFWRLVPEKFAYLSVCFLCTPDLKIQKDKDALQVLYLTWVWYSLGAFQSPHKFVKLFTVSVGADTSKMENERIEYITSLLINMYEWTIGAMPIEQLVFADQQVQCKVIPFQYYHTCLHYLRVIMKCLNYCGAKLREQSAEDLIHFGLWEEGEITADIGQEISYLDQNKWHAFRGGATLAIEYQKNWKITFQSTVTKPLHTSRHHWKKDCNLRELIEVMSHSSLFKQKIATHVVQMIASHPFRAYLSDFMKRLLRAEISVKDSKIQLMHLVYKQSLCKPVPITTFIDELMPHELRLVIQKYETICGVKISRADGIYVYREHSELIKHWISSSKTKDFYHYPKFLITELSEMCQEPKQLSEKKLRLLIKLLF